MNETITQVYRSAMKEDDFLKADTGVSKGSFIKIGEYTVLAGELVRLGYGDNNTQNGAQGRIFADIKDNAVAPGANLDGTLRISVHSAQGQPLKVLAQYRTETLRTNISDRSLQIPFPNTAFPYVSRDKKIVLEFSPDVDGKTVGATNTTILFDITLALTA